MCITNPHERPPFIKCGRTLSGKLQEQLQDGPVQPPTTNTTDDPLVCFDHVGSDLIERPWFEQVRKTTLPNVPLRPVHLVHLLKWHKNKRVVEQELSMVCWSLYSWIRLSKCASEATSAKPNCRWRQHSAHLYPTTPSGATLGKRRMASTQFSKTGDTRDWRYRPCYPR